MLSHPGRSRGRKTGGCKRGCCAPPQLHESRFWRLRDAHRGLGQPSRHRQGSENGDKVTSDARSGHLSSLGRLNLSTGLRPGIAASGSGTDAAEQDNHAVPYKAAAGPGNCSCSPSPVFADTTNFFFLPSIDVKYQKQGFKRANFSSCSYWSHQGRFLLDLKPQRNPSPAVSCGRMQDRQSWLTPAECPTTPHQAQLQLLICKVHLCSAQPTEMHVHGHFAV